MNRDDVALMAAEVILEKILITDHLIDQLTADGSSMRAMFKWSADRAYDFADAMMEARGSGLSPDSKVGLPPVR